MSGGIQGSGGQRGLGEFAVCLLATACMFLDADGTICASVSDLARATGFSSRTVHRYLLILEQHGLIHTRGQTRSTYRYVDERILRALQVPIARRTHDRGWRELRARCGGFERALRAATAQRDAAREQVAVLSAAAASPDRYGRGVAWLAAELRHASNCAAPECARCLSAARALEDDDSEAVRAAARRVEQLEAAARALTEAVRARSREGVAAAAAEIEKVVTS